MDDILPMNEGHYNICLCYSQFQSQNEKELKQIFDGQNMIHLVMKELNRKVDELMGRQEMVLSRVNSMPQGQQQFQQQPGQPQIQQQVTTHFGKSVRVN